MIDTARHAIAVITVVVSVPAMIFWLVAHGFVGRWRRLGLVIAYTALLGVMVVSGLAVYAMRDLLIARDLGTSRVLIGLSLVTYASALAIDVRCRKQLGLRILVGIPELAPDATEQRLLREGIYSRIRHPRYVSALLGFLALAMFANHAGLYLLCPVLALAIYWITVLEERDLVQRFGTDYERYRAEVPRFVPRMR